MFDRHLPDREKLGAHWRSGLAVPDENTTLIKQFRGGMGAFAHIDHRGVIVRCISRWTGRRRSPPYEMLDGPE